MLPKIPALLGCCLALPYSVLACGEYSHNNLTWSQNVLRMNHIQVVGTHNSYHIETPPEERKAQTGLIFNPKNLWYTHRDLNTQLSSQHMRNLELDLLADPEGGNYATPLIRQMSGLPFDDDPVWKQRGTKVLHIPDIDIHSVCNTFVSCLKIVKKWIDENPGAVPIPIMVEFKTTEKDRFDRGGSAAKYIPWDNVTLLDGVDEEIRSVFPPEQLITPDDLTRKAEKMTLEESVVKYGWPDLESARGRVFFLMDNGPESDVSKKYKEGKPNLEGRIIFTNASPGDSDCAFQKLNDPISNKQIARIKDQVKKNYYVRTRADVPLETVTRDKCSTSRRDKALASGAHIVSTDFPERGMSDRWGCEYWVSLEGGNAARCNPVNAPEGCDDGIVEKL